MAVVLRARTAGTVGRAAERMHSREAVERDAIVKERRGFSGRIGLSRVAAAEDVVVRDG